MWNTSMSNILKPGKHRIVFALLLALLLEVTVFQYRTYLTLGNDPIEVTPKVYTGGVQNADGSFTVEETLKLKTDNMEENVNSLRLSFSIENSDSKEDAYASYVAIYARDEANEDYYIVGERNVLEEVPSTGDMILHLSGKMHSMVIIFSADAGETVRVSEMTLNPRIPMRFSALRVLLAFLTILWIWLAVCPVEKKQHEKGILAAVILLQTGLFIGAVLLNPIYREDVWEHHMQYHKLAVALSEGHLYLDDAPPASLLTMENPYDFDSRNRILENAGEECLWDVAYYQGAYYVYFGVVPVLVFYLPWYLLTGTAFPTWVGILIIGILLIGGTFLLTYELRRKYFPKVPFMAWILTTLMMINGCGALTIMRRPDFYSLPILMGVTLSVYGITFWLSSLEETKVNGWKLAAGCLCMALVAGCRPQLLIGSFLIFPIFWNAVFVKRQLFSKDSKGKTFAAILMYVLIAVCLMIYNYKRFGSVFDFGANYNLTTNDMTKRGVELGRIPYALFTYLFQLPAVSAAFPYLLEVMHKTTYLGKTISEGTFGGFFTVNLIPLAAFFVLRHKIWFAENERMTENGKRMYGMAGLSLLFGIVIVIADAEAAGILPRYYSDFGWLFYIGGIICFYAAWQHNAESTDRAKLLHIFLNISFAICMAYNFLLLFIDNSETLVSTAPVRFYSICQQLAFWR